MVPNVAFTTRRRNTMDNSNLTKANKSLRKAQKLVEQAMKMIAQGTSPSVVVPAVVKVTDKYSIGKYPVTNAEYLAFMQATGYQPPKHWVNGVVPDGKLDHPVTYVSYYDAVEYCKWLSSVTGRAFRLPSGDEWTMAATGGDGREYPWGNKKPDETLCNFNMNVGDTTPVGKYPDGASPCGAEDMAGNVWEWTSEEYK